MTRLEHWAAFLERNYFPVLSQAFCVILILGLLLAALVVGRTLGPAVDQLRNGAAWGQICRRHILPSLYRGSLIFHIPLILGMQLLVSNDWRLFPLLMPVDLIFAMIVAVVPAVLGTVVIYACAVDNPLKVVTRVKIVGIPLALWFGFVAFWGAAGK